MTKDERRIYSRGYAAGRKKRKKDAELLSDKQFWDEAFLRTLGDALTVQGWKFGDRPILDTKDRCKLAACWADRALEQRRKRII